MRMRLNQALHSTLISPPRVNKHKGQLPIGQFQGVVSAPDVQEEEKVLVLLTKQCM